MHWILMSPLITVPPAGRCQYLFSFKMYLQGVEAAGSPHTTSESAETCQRSSDLHMSGVMICRFSKS